jgi:hypothetical protein
LAGTLTCALDFSIKQNHTRSISSEGHQKAATKTNFKLDLVDPIHAIAEKDNRDSVKRMTCREAEMNELHAEYGERFPGYRSSGFRRR